MHRAFPDKTICQLLRGTVIATARTGDLGHTI